MIGNSSIAAAPAMFSICFSSKTLGFQSKLASPINGGRGGWERKKTWHFFFVCLFRGFEQEGPLRLRLKLCRFGKEDGAVDSKHPFPLLSSLPACLLPLPGRHRVIPPLPPLPSAHSPLPLRKLGAKKFSLFSVSVFDTRCRRLWRRPRRRRRRRRRPPTRRQPRRLIPSFRWILSWSHLHPPPPPAAGILLLLLLLLLPPILPLIARNLISSSLRLPSGTLEAAAAPTPFLARYQDDPVISYNALYCLHSSKHSSFSPIVLSRT